jgi:phage-related minor tail protein
MSSDRLTEILNYLSAISREVGNLRTEMNARFDRLDTETKAGFEAVRTDIRLLKRQFEVMTQDLMEVRRNQRDLEVRTGALESKQA